MKVKVHTLKVNEHHIEHGRSFQFKLPQFLVLKLTAGTFQTSNAVNQWILNALALGPTF